MKKFVKYVKFDIKDYGYFDSPEQTEPKVRPQSKKCLICGKENDSKIRSICIMMDDQRSWFYYVHIFCHDNLRKKDAEALDWRLTDYLERKAKSPRKKENLNSFINQLKEVKKVIEEL